MPTTSLEQFLNYGSAAEARAMLNTMLVASQIESLGNVDVITTGYGTDVELTALFNAFAGHRNVGTLLAEFTEMFLSFPWTGEGARDADGDGKINQKDKLIDDYEKGRR